MSIPKLTARPAPELVAGFDPYRPRSIRPLEVWRFSSWALKVYGIAYRDMPGDDLLAAARRVAQERISASASSAHAHYGVGFMGVHAGKTGSRVFVAWWADESELHYHLYAAPPDDPSALAYRDPGGLLASVWDMEVLSHEREAWVEHVLRRPKAWKLEAYLADVLDTGPIQQRRSQPG